jgi:ABC-type enterochelin transport system permease subunit
VFEWVSNTAGVTIPRAIQFAVLMVCVTAVVLLTYKAYVRLNHLRLENRPMINVFLICLVYALIHPRLKDYAYILLIVPSFYIIRNSRFTKFNPFIFFLVIVAFPPYIVPGSEFIFRFFWSYYTLFVAYAIWAMYLNEIFSAGEDLSNAPFSRNV